MKRTTCLLALGSLLSCQSTEPDGQEAMLCGAEKKTWVLSKEDGRALPPPNEGFAFYRQGHFYQSFRVVTTNGRHRFQASSRTDQPLPLCNTTWDTTGDTIFLAYPRHGRQPLYRVVRLRANELTFQRFTRDGAVNPTTLTAVAVPDTVTNALLNCPPGHTYSEADDVKMLD